MALSPCWGLLKDLDKDGTPHTLAKTGEPNEPSEVEVRTKPRTVMIAPRVHLAYRRNQDGPGRPLA